MLNTFLYFFCGYLKRGTRLSHDAGKTAGDMTHTRHRRRLDPKWTIDFAIGQITFGQLPREAWAVGSDGRRGAL